MGSYNRKQCNRPGCETFIYDGDTFCIGHNHLVAEVPYPSPNDTPATFHLYSNNSVVSQPHFLVYDRDGELCYFTVEQLKVALAEFGMTLHYNNE